MCIETCTYSLKLLWFVWVMWGSLMSYDLWLNVRSSGTKFYAWRLWDKCSKAFIENATISNSLYFCQTNHDLYDFTVRRRRSGDASMPQHSCLRAETTQLRHLRLLNWTVFGRPVHWCCRLLLLTILMGHGSADLQECAKTLKRRFCQRVLLRLAVRPNLAGVTVIEGFSVKSVSGNRGAGS